MEEAMTEKKEEAEHITTPRRDRDDFVLKYLERHRELIPTQLDYREHLPKPSIEALRVGLVEAGWWEYGEKHPNRSKLPATCLRASLERLQKSGRLPTRPHGRPQGTGKKVAPKEVAAKVVTKTFKKSDIDATIARAYERNAFCIEAARSGLKVRWILPDGTVIEVLP